MNSFWERLIWDNTVRDWAIACGIILGSLILFHFMKKEFLFRLQQWTRKTKSSLDDFLLVLVEKFVWPFLNILFVYYVLTNYLSLPTKVTNTFRVAMVIVSTIFVGRLITSSLSYIVDKAAGKDPDAASKRRQARGIILIMKIVVWILAFLFLIDNMGYDITTLVAGLGIGGIAIALAAQAVLGDLFSYFVIFFDKPFEVGDFISFGDKLGIVEYVGIKTTRIRALSGEQLVVSNTDLTNARVQNFKRMERRRVAFSIGVLYETPVDKLERIPVMIRVIIESLPDLSFDRVHLLAFGDSSLNFEIVYYVTGPDYNLYMDRQQAINLGIIRAFQKEKIDIAYPTQKIYFGKTVKNDHQQNPNSKKITAD